MSRVWHRTGQALACSFEGHIDPFAGAGAGGFSLQGAIPGSRQDGVHIQRGCIPVLSLLMAWIGNNGKPSSMNSEKKETGPNETLELDRVAGQEAARKM